MSEGRSAIGGLSLRPDSSNSQSASWQGCMQTSEMLSARRYADPNLTSPLSSTPIACRWESSHLPEVEFRNGRKEIMLPERFTADIPATGTCFRAQACCGLSARVCCFVVQAPTRVQPSRSLSICESRAEDTESLVIR